MHTHWIGLDWMGVFSTISFFSRSYLLAKIVLFAFNLWYNHKFIDRNRITFQHKIWIALIPNNSLHSFFSFLDCTLIGSPPPLSLSSLCISFLFIKFRAAAFFLDIQTCFICILSTMYVLLLYIYVISSNFIYSHKTHFVQNVKRKESTIHK